MTADSVRLADATGLSSASSIEPVPVAPVPASIPSAVWLIWASEGEYSDRAEWPVVAVTDEAAAQRLVERLTELWRSADQKWRRVEPEWYDKAVEDAFWRNDADAAEYRRLTGEAGHLGGCYSDERSFTCCEVELLTASAIEARRAETGTGSVHESAAGDSRDAQGLAASPTASGERERG